MQSLEWIHCILAICAAFRLTTLFVADSIWNRARVRWPAVPWHCSLCMSVWGGGLATLFFLLLPWLNWPLGMSWFYLAYQDWLVIQKDRITQERKDSMIGSYLGRSTVVKINFDKQLLTVDGDTVPIDGTKDEKGKTKDETPMTLKFACARAICVPMQGDDLKPEDAWKRLELARKISKGGEQDIEPADAVLIQTRAAKVWPIEVAGQVYELLRG